MREHDLIQNDNSIVLLFYVSHFTGVFHNKAILMLNKNTEALSHDTDSQSVSF